MSGQSNLKNLFNFSFPGVHLLQISLVKDLSNEDSYKRKHFSFITIVPGKKVDQSVSVSGRTFDWSNRINMKAEADRILALSYDLKTLCEASKYFYVENNQQTDQAVLFAIRQSQLMRKTLENSVSGFSLFADSSRSSYGDGQGSVKSFSLQLSGDQKKLDRPVIILWGKEGQGKALNYTMTPPQAMSVAKVCDFIANKTLELEFEHQQNAEPRTQQNDYQQSFPQGFFNSSQKTDFNTLSPATETFSTDGVETINSHFGNALNNLGGDDNPF